jgi:hypothetical protein
MWRPLCQAQWNIWDQYNHQMWNYLMTKHHLYCASEIEEQDYLYLVCFFEVPLCKVCFVGVKEQLISDSEGFAMMYDEWEDKSEKIKNIFFSLLFIQHLFFNI